MGMLMGRHKDRHNPHVQAEPEPVVEQAVESEPEPEPVEDKKGSNKKKRGE
jgi:hypothetical protein